MAERLTDQALFSGLLDADDRVYVVDRSDTTDNPAGSSRQMKIEEFLAGHRFQKINGCLVYKNPPQNSATVIEDQDWLIYIDGTGAGRLVIGFVLPGFTTVPTDFDDPTKFMKFVDNQAAI